MSSSKSSKSQSYSGSGQQWAQPLATNAANQVSSVYSANQPNLQATTNLQRQSVINPLLTQFGNTMGPAAAASGYYGDVLGGKYLNGNPYVGQVVSNLNRDVANNVNSQFEGAGRYGSDSYAGELARQTGIADTNLLYGNYSDEMNRMAAAAAGATNANVGTEQALAGAIGQNAALPYTGTSAMAGSLGQLFSGGTGTQVTYQPNPIWGALGAGMSAAGQIWSDRSLKTKIEPLATDRDGLTLYAFEYKSLPGVKFKGVMADEVKELRPAAYIHNFRESGFAGVDYGKL